MESPLQGRSHLIFCDGACSGNPGPGGWGAIWVDPSGRVREFAGAENPTTNNRMELIGTIEPLRRLGSVTEPVFLYSDSAYMLYGITQWVWGWKKRGWKTASGEDVANKDLWLELSSVVDPIRKWIQFKYSRGHTGIPGNERCDEMAVMRSKGGWVDLYDGPLSRYPVAIYDLPEKTELPELKDRKEKKVAVAYLSFLDGKLVRHKTWPECERRVKGRSGAKFKKVMDFNEEVEILGAWGLAPDTPIIDDGRS